MKSRSTVIASQAAVIAAVLVLWEVIARSGLMSASAFPPFTAVVSSLVEAVGTSDYWLALWDTMWGAILGFLIATIVAVPLGVLIGSVRFFERSTQILVDFGRSFPAIAVLPIFVLLYGTGVTTKTIVVFIGCVFPIFMQAFYGARRVDPAVLETSRAFRIPRLLHLRRIVLPAATPSIMTGLRLGVTMAILLAIGAEILAGIPGLGQRITGAQQDGASDVAFAFIITASLLGFLASRLAKGAEDQLLRWRPPSDVS